MNTVLVGSVMAVMLLLSVVDSYPGGRGVFGDHGDQQHRQGNSANSRLQIKRGFGDRQMSTARSFGKRHRNPLLADQSLKGVRAEWLAEHLQEYPTLAQKFVNSYLDLDGDERITPEEVYAFINDSSDQELV